MGIRLPEAFAAYRALLETRRLLPEQLVQPERRAITLVDIVSSGHTLHYLVRLLHRLACESRTDWNAVRRKINIVGLCQQSKNSPNTWRWQQHSLWVNELLTSNAVKNVSMSPRLYFYLADHQIKTTRSFTPNRWDQPDPADSLRTERPLMALRLARTLFETGQAGQTRLEFARQMAEQREMRYPWFRRLVTEMYRVAHRS